MTDDSYREALFYKVNWSPRDGGGYLTHVAGLGIVEVFRAKDGACCEINGKRHSSAYRHGVEGARSRMTDEIRSWVYLRWFANISQS